MEEKQNISLEQDLARYRQYYQENIAPRLRVKQYYGHSLPAGLVSILFLGLLIALWLFFPSFDKDTVVERIIGAFLCWLGCDRGIRFAFFRWYRYTRQRWQILRNETGKFFGLIYKEPETIPLDMIETLSAMGMLLPKKEPKYAYWGEQHGLSTDIFYIRTGRKEENCSKKNDPEIYLFMLVHRLRTPLQGETILLYNSLSSKWGGKKAGLHRIKLEWLAFEEQFDLFSDSEKEARLIMQPDVMQAVYDFCRAYPDLKSVSSLKKNIWLCWWKIMIQRKICRPTGFRPLLKNFSVRFGFCFIYQCSWKAKRWPRPGRKRIIFVNAAVKKLQPPRRILPKLCPRWNNGPAIRNPIPGKPWRLTLLMLPV